MKNIIQMIAISLAIAFLVGCQGTIDPQPTTFATATAGGNNFTSGTTLAPASITVPAGNTSSSTSGGSSSGSGSGLGTGTTSGSGSGSTSITFNGSSYTSLTANGLSSPLGYTYSISNSDINNLLSITVTFPSKPTTSKDYTLSTSSVSTSVSLIQGNNSYVASSGTIKVTVSGSSVKLEFSNVSMAGLSGNSKTLTGTISV